MLGQVEVVVDGEWLVDCLVDFVIDEWFEVVLVEQCYYQYQYGQQCYQCVDDLCDDFVFVFYLMFFVVWMLWFVLGGMMVMGQWLV